jgi:hypothetical protein
MEAKCECFLRHTQILIMDSFTFQYAGKDIKVSQVPGATDVYKIEVDQVFSGYIASTYGVFTTQPGSSIEVDTFTEIQQNIRQRS